MQIKVLLLECKMATPHHILIEGTIDVSPAGLTNRSPIYTFIRQYNDKSIMKIRQTNISEGLANAINNQSVVHSNSAFTRESHMTMLIYLDCRNVGIRF